MKYLITTTDTRKNAKVPAPFTVEVQTSLAGMIAGRDHFDTLRPKRFTKHSIADGASSGDGVTTFYWRDERFTIEVTVTPISE